MITEISQKQQQQQQKLIKSAMFRYIMETI